MTCLVVGPKRASDPQAPRSDEDHDSDRVQEREGRSPTIASFTVNDRSLSVPKHTVIWCAHSDLTCIAEVGVAPRRSIGPVSAPANGVTTPDDVGGMETSRM